MSNLHITPCSGCPPHKCSEDKYCGPNLPGTGILTGDSIAVALQKIDEVIFSITGVVVIPPVGTTSTTTTIVPPTTTTTTTVPCTSWIYTANFHSCGDCSIQSTININNSEPLTVGKWYNYFGIGKLYIVSFFTCSPTSPSISILDIDKKDTCEEFVCVIPTAPPASTTTTTTTDIPTTTTTTTL